MGNATKSARKPVCHNCGEPATCIGQYERMATPEPSCDDCCGHACEDGHCNPIEAPRAGGASYRVVAQDYGYTLRSEDDDCVARCWDEDTAKRIAEAFGVETIETGNAHVGSCDRCGKQAAND